MSRSLRLFVPTLMALVVLTANAFATVPCCLAPDNGNGTTTLPAFGPSDGCLYLGSTEIVDGLPVGTTIQIAGSFGFFTNVVEAAGGVLGGTFSWWDGTFTMTMTGTGTLSGFNRVIQVPLVATQANRMDWGPRAYFAPVQSAPAQVYRMFGQVTGDPDFDLLRIVGGNDFGLPSPGQIQLVSSGGGWAVSGFFDLAHRIDFVGKPGSSLAGLSGSTTRERRFELCPENAVATEPTTWSRVKTMYRD